MYYDNDYWNQKSWGGGGWFLCGDETLSVLICLNKTISEKIATSI